MLSTTQRQDLEPLGLKAWEIRQSNVQRALMRRCGVLGFCMAAGGFMVWPLSDPGPAPASAHMSAKLSEQAPAVVSEGDRILPPRLGASTSEPAPAFRPELQPEPPRRQTQTAAARDKTAVARPSATSDLDWYKTIPR